MHGDVPGIAEPDTASLNASVAMEHRMISDTSGSGPAAGVADQQVGRGHASRREQFSELIGDLGGGARQLPPGRSTGPGPVVDDARSELRRPLLNIPVVQADRAAPSRNTAAGCLRPSGAAGGGLPRRDTATAAAAPPSGDRGLVLTTTDLCSCLPDVPKITVYGHVGLLAEAGVLQVAGEQPVYRPAGGCTHRCGPVCA